MKYLAAIILLIFSSIAILPADTITLSNGDILIGQLLKVSKNNILIEVIRDGKGVETISLKRNTVDSVVDESKTTLYIYGNQLEEDLEDYYQKKHLDFSSKESVKDTIVLKNGEMIVGNIIRINKNNITYKQSNKSSAHQITTTLEEIDTINGQKVQSVLYINTYYPPPINRVFNYPHPAFEFGLTLIQHDLNQYHNIYGQLIENLEENNIPDLKDVNNPLIAINLGFDLKFSSRVSLSFLGNFLLNYGDTEDSHNEVESFRLFLTELRYTFPVKSFFPWLGVGYALQSITLINNYSSVDITFKSRSKTVSFAFGTILSISHQFEGNFSLRYLPFGDKNIRLIDRTDNIQTVSKINLTNILFSASLNINL